MEQRKGFFFLRQDFYWGFLQLQTNHSSLIFSDDTIKPQSAHYFAHTREKLLVLPSVKDAHCPVMTLSPLISLQGQR